MLCQCWTDFDFETIANCHGILFEAEKASTVNFGVLGYVVLGQKLLHGAARAV
jgi:hypothetical protein